MEDKYEKNKQFSSPLEINLNNFILYQASSLDLNNYSLQGLNSRQREFMEYFSKVMSVNYEIYKENLKSGVVSVKILIYKVYKRCRGFKNITS